MIHLQHQPVIGADIGGSHITAAIISDGIIVDHSRSRIKIDPHGPADQVLDAWAGCLANVMQHLPAGSACIGIAMPGPFDYENGISLIRGLKKYDQLYGVNVKKELALRLGFPAENLIFRNDAESFLRGEVFAGAGRGASRVAGITLGTGLGSASAVNGEIKDENRAVLPYGDSIAEEYISTRWFVHRYFELSGRQEKDVKAIIAAADGTGEFRQLINEFVGHLSWFISRFIVDVRPEIIVIGGNIAQASAYFLPQLREKLAFNFSNVKIALTELWEDAALAGAASLFVRSQSPETI